MNATDTVDMDARPRRDPSAIGSEVLDELVLYSPVTSSAVSLNASARAIWELCDGGRTLAQICDELSAAAGGPAPGLRSDVVAAVERFEQLGLLHRGA